MVDILTGENLPSIQIANIDLIGQLVHAVGMRGLDEGGGWGVSLL